MVDIERHPVEITPAALELLERHGRMIAEIAAQYARDREAEQVARLDLAVERAAREGILLVRRDGDLDLREVVSRNRDLALDHGTLDLPRVATMRFLDGLVVEWNDYQDFRDTARALGHDPRC